MYNVVLSNNIYIYIIYIYLYIYIYIYRAASGQNLKKSHFRELFLMFFCSSDPHEHIASWLFSSFLLPWSCWTLWTLLKSLDSYQKKVIGSWSGGLSWVSGQNGPFWGISRYKRPPWPARTFSTWYIYIYICIYIIYILYILYIYHLT